MNPGHQPERFQVYSVLPDGKGFTIKGSSHLFVFDRYGGWYDEYDNYYNENGEPDQPPLSDEEDNYQQGYSQGSEESDQFQREFGAPRDLSDEEEFQLNQHQVQALARNLFALQSYPPSQLLRIHFHNLPTWSRKQQVLKAYNAVLDNGITNVIFDKDQDGRNKGTGYFIAKPDIAEKLIKLEGQRIIQSPLKFNVEDYQQFIRLPIREKELTYSPQKTKKYVLKNPPKQETVIAKQPQGVWRWYKFQKQIFPKKSQFKNWMMENGFNAEQDFKNLQKLQNDPQKKYIKVEMKESTFKSINGVDFEGQSVTFIPL